MSGLISGTTYETEQAIQALLGNGVEKQNEMSYMSRADGEALWGIVQR